MHIFPFSFTSPITISVWVYAIKFVKYYNELFASYINFVVQSQWLPEDPDYYKHRQENGIVQ